MKLTGNFTQTDNNIYKLYDEGLDIIAHGIHSLLCSYHPCRVTARHVYEKLHIGRTTFFKKIKILYSLHLIHLVKREENYYVFEVRSFAEAKKYQDSEQEGVRQTNTYVRQDSLNELPPFAKRTPSVRQTNSLLHYNNINNNIKNNIEESNHPATQGGKSFEQKVEGIAILWNRLCDACILFDSRILTDLNLYSKSRKKLLAEALEKFPTSDYWELAFEGVRRREFVHGKNEHGYEITFDDFLKNENYIKYYERGKSFRDKKAALERRLELIRSGESHE